MRSIFILTILLSFMSSSVIAQWIAPGKLTRSHSKIEGLTNCVKCHELGKGVLDSACLTCHEKLVERLQAQKGFHATVQGKCIECHTDHKGEDYDIMQFEKEAFDHKRTGYELQDKHKTSCEKCHKKEKTYLGLSTDCLDCHKDVHRKSLSGDCLRCHNYRGWKELTFDHDKYSEYKLIGKHATVKCDNCHPAYTNEDGTNKGNETDDIRILKFKPLKHDKCTDCHYDIHKGQLKEKSCEKCHSPEGWEKKTFEHNDPQFSSYKLLGKHEKVSCELCHPDEKTRYTQNGNTIEKTVKKLKAVKHDTCGDCHYDVHQGQFKDQKCSACHTVENEWKKNTFRHESGDYKGYKLEGKHKDVACEKCHVRSEVRFTEFGKKKDASLGTFKPLRSETCGDCHYDVHQGQFKDQKCSACHTVENEWKKNTFRHESGDYKGYKLEGKHKDVACEKCHVRSEVSYKEFEKYKQISAGRFKPIEYQKCVTCHEDKHKGKFEKNCETCHSPENWEPKKYLHDPVTFQMKGVHRTLNCRECHKITNKFSGLDSACNSCHKGPHHNQFGPFCADCHRQDAWIPPSFNHTGIGFRLVGQHRAADCADCHVNRDYRNTPSDCYACHETDYLSAPMHASGNYSHECSECHRITGTWEQVSFSHSFFTFKGAHSALRNDCSECHIPGRQIPPGTTNSDCYNCHSASGVATTRYERVTSPSHTTFNFSKTCTECHRGSSWSPARYRHQTFQLSGVHRTLDCSSCHQGGFPGPYAGVTDDECFSCHAADYQSAPDHVNFGYPQECRFCHSGNTWEM